MARFEGRDRPASVGRIGVVGVISSFRNEGRSTVAINLARLAARDGTKVLMVDGDLRNPQLSRSIVPTATTGLLQSLQGQAILPVRSGTTRPRHFISCRRERQRTPRWQAACSCPPVWRARFRPCGSITISSSSLPPVIPVADVRAVAHLFDAFLFVVEWGATTPADLSQVFQGGVIDTKIIGSVLNKVDVAKARRFE